MGEQSEDKGGRDLVRRVGDADIKIGQLCFHKVTDDDLEPPLLGPGENKGWDEWKRAGKTWIEYALALYTLYEFGGHARIHLHRGAMFGLLQYPHGEIPSPWTNFEDLIRRMKVGLERGFI